VLPNSSAGGFLRGTWGGGAVVLRRGAPMETQYRGRVLSVGKFVSPRRCEQIFRGSGGGLPQKGIRDLMLKSTRLEGGGIHGYLRSSDKQAAQKGRNQVGYRQSLGSHEAREIARLKRGARPSE